jgi:hypothetical protein
MGVIVVGLDRSDSAKAALRFALEGGAAAPIKSAGRARLAVPLAVRPQRGG